MKNIGANDDKIKKLIKKDYEKDCVVVDDLFTLSLQNCKNSSIKYTLICEELLEKIETKKLAEYYIKNSESYLISKKIFERIASKDNLAGIIVYTKIKQAKLEDFQNFNNILVCDGIEISGNIGTMIRTAEATKTDAIIFTNLKAKVYDEKIIHASRGMIFQVPFIILSIEETFNLLSKYGFTPVVCEPEQGVDFKNFKYSKKQAYVVGSERFGCDKQWFNLNKLEYLKIPMYGIMDSLNVAVAASLIMYEVKYAQKL